MRLWKLLVVLLAAWVPLAACSDDDASDSSEDADETSEEADDEGGAEDEGEDGAPTAEEITEAILAVIGPDVTVDVTEYATCIGDGLADEIDGSDLAALGVTSEAIAAGTDPISTDTDLIDIETELSDDEVRGLADLIAETQVSCAYPDFFVANFSAGGTDEQVAVCAVEAMDPDELAAAAAADIYEGDDSQLDAIFQEAFTACA